MKLGQRERGICVGGCPIAIIPCHFFLFVYSPDFRVDEVFGTFIHPRVCNILPSYVFRNEGVMIMNGFPEGYGVSITSPSILFEIFCRTISIGNG